jgi:hypothetical protein
MTNRDQLSQARGEHDRAVDRLNAAVEKQSRVRDERDGARGAPAEMQADASLRTADEEVAARERWLEAVEDHDD